MATSDYVDNQDRPLGWIGDDFHYNFVSPAVYELGFQDISKPNSGRGEDGLMKTGKFSPKVTIQLEWHYLTTAQISKILKLVKWTSSNDTFKVRYLDPCNGTTSGTANDPSDYFVEKWFYVGDREAPMYNATKKLWTNLSFKLIEV